MTGPLLEVRNLKVDFALERGAVLQAVKGVTFSVPENGSVALVGESGSGKSVTALSILGLLPRANACVHAASRILWRGRDLLEANAHELTALRGAEIAMVFQEPMSSLNPVFSVGFQLTEVLRKHLGLSGKRAHERAIALMEEVGISESARRIDAYPHQLSGGQQQRVMIAMAIACEPRLLIADEPTTALDVTVQRQILDLIGEIRKRRQMALLFISHDLGLVGEVAEHVVVMRDGEVREQGPARQVFAAPVDAYSRALLACRPPLDSRPRRLPVVDDFINGTLPQVATHARARSVAGNEAVVLEVKQLSKAYVYKDGWFGHKSFHALSDVSFNLAKGTTLGVVGESGCGKTTMALALMRLIDASSGHVLFEGRDLATLTPRETMLHRRRMQIVFQNPYASLNPRYSIAQALIEPMQLHGIGADERERQVLALDLLAKVGLPESAFFKYPHELSGGQRQRVAIARCIALKPEVLICDEAVSALDLSVQAQLLNLLQDLQDELDMSYIFISHDLAVVKYMSDSVMVMKDGVVVEMAGADELYARPQNTYTKQLLSSISQVRV